MKENTEILMLEGAPQRCLNCNSQICLRKQVMNLALGNTDSMYCLVCLGKLNQQTPLTVMGSLKPYILSRECLAKEWLKYADSRFCPDPDGCLPEQCFSEKE